MPQYPLTAFAPGIFVRHPEHPEWGIGQVQSALESRVTVTFENVGKVVMDTLIAPLEATPEDVLDAAPSAAQVKELE